MSLDESLSKIIGHSKVKKLIPRWLQAPASSYIFYGPPHLGKSLIAEVFVRGLLSCNESRDLHTHPDAVLFEVQEGSRDVKVEAVREARARLYSRPQLAPRMVAFLPSLERLNDEGFNTLLKVMEEPPAGAVFVSVANDLRRVPATVLSRSVAIRMSQVSAVDIAAGLVARGVAQPRAQKIASQSRGFPGLALSVDGPASAFGSAADIYALGPKLADRLSAIDDLERACNGYADPVPAWNDALSACTESIARSWSKLGSDAIILGTGVADAVASQNTGISARYLLATAAINVSQKRLVLPDLYPRHFPLTLCI